MKQILHKDDWKLVRLDEVVNRREENDRENARDRFDTFVKVEHMEAESLHMREFGSQKDEQLPPTFHKIFRKGNILFPTRNPHLRRTALAPCDGICGEKTLTLEVDNAIAHPKFIPFLFHSTNFYDHSAGVIIGSTNPHCRWRDIARYEFFLPPKDQQAKLAELLWAGDDLVQNIFEINAKILKARNSYFHETVESQHGTISSLSSVIKPKRVKSNPPHKEGKYIGLENVKPGEFSCTSFSDVTEIVSQCNIISKGDLCYSKLRPNLDKAFIADFAGFSTTELIVYEAIRKKVSLEYVLYVMHSADFIHQMTSKGFGTKMPRVNVTDIGSYQIKIISEEAQSEMLTQLASFNNCLNASQLNLSSVKNILKSLINQIF